MATRPPKPPLTGWLSLPFFWITGSWNLAWRLPGYLCTLAMLLILAREARRILPDFGVLLVICAFGLNLLTPANRDARPHGHDVGALYHDLRIADLQEDCEWTVLDAVGEVGVFLCDARRTSHQGTHSLRLPSARHGGLLLSWSEGSPPSLVWSGWWTWLLPLALFVAWLVIGCSTKPEFYDDVVIREFMSRFDQTLKAHERQQPIWFYFPHLIHKFAPWSLLALALPIASENVRRRIKSDPGTLWLACWALGGLLCMTFVPSKRVDRIFPVVPPLCLLLVSMVSACQCGKRIRAWCGGAVVFAVMAVCGYFLTVVLVGYQRNEDALVRFGEKVQKATREAGAARIGVVEGRDEPMVIYCGADSYLPVVRAMRAWKNGDIDALVIPERRIADPSLLPPPALDSGPISKQKETRYLLFLRPK